MDTNAQSLTDCPQFAITQEEQELLFSSPEEWKQQDETPDGGNYFGLCPVVVGKGQPDSDD